MITRQIGLALGVAMMSMAAQAQVLTSLENPGLAAGGNRIPGIAGTPPGLSPADLAAFSGLGVSRNSGTLTGGITGIVDGIGFAGGAGSPPPPVPEPETYAMLMAGLGLLPFLSRRRKKGRKP